MASAASATERGASELDPAELNESTRLAVTRTRLAAERTLMSWVRTAFAMISFGFTIGKFFQYMSKQYPTAAPQGGIRVIPIALIVLGLVSLLLGELEYRRTLTELDATSRTRHRVTALGVIVTLVALLGVLAFAGLFVRIRFL
jgi:putative membrane protein